MRIKKIMDIDEMAAGLLELALSSEKLSNKKPEEQVKEAVKHFDNIRKKVAAIENTDKIIEAVCPPNDPDCPRRIRSQTMKILKSSLSRESFGEAKLSEKIDRIVNCVEIIYKAKQA